MYIIRILIYIYIMIRVVSLFVFVYCECFFEYGFITTILKNLSCVNMYYCRCYNHRFVVIVSLLVVMIIIVKKEGAVLRLFEWYRVCIPFWFFYILIVLITFLFFLITLYHYLQLNSTQLNLTQLSLHTIFTIVIYINEL